METRVYPPNKDSPPPPPPDEVTEEVEEEAQKPQGHWHQQNKKKKNIYLCSRCHVPKKGHKCPKQLSDTLIQYKYKRPAPRRKKLCK